MYRKLTSQPAAFTLVELLVTITIISILATTIMFGMSGVQNTAKAQRTKSQIKRIHEMIADKWESYESRGLQFAVPGSPTSIERLAALRELMRLELPDRISDVRPDYTMLENPAGVFTCRTGIARPALNQSYHRRVLAHGGYATWTTQHQGAECLYMILAQTQVGDSNGLEFFSEQEIGDVDQDGMPEILDAWGNPIQFIRWPSGFIGPSSYQTATVDSGPDALDLMLADPRLADNNPANDTYAIFPLIFSNGPDEIDNVVADVKVQGNDPPEAETVLYRNTDMSPYGAHPGLKSDPYVTIPTGVAGERVRIGSWEDANRDSHIDNITNHDLTTRL